MRIIFLGNFEVPYSSENHHAKSLESLGHTVIKLQENIVDINVVVEKATKSDLFVWVHTHGWETPGGMSMKLALELIKENKVPIISYHLDLYMGITRWDEYKDSDLFLVDYFFTVDKRMAEWLNKNTDVKGHFIPAGVYDRECYIDSKVSPVRDVIFVGSRGYHPEWTWRPQLIDWLKDTYKNNFYHYGGDGLGTIRGPALNRLYAQTKVVVGDTLSMNFDHPYYFSDRLFETTGRGGFILFPFIKGIRDYFTTDELMTYRFGDFDGLKERIDYYLENDIEREEIRRAGHERTKRDHTYKNRWEEILEILK